MTTIEWTEETWNPFRAKNKETGKNGHFCVKVSPGCKHCYAERLQPRYRNFVRFAAQDAAKVDLFLDQKVLLRPLSMKRPREIFPCSMTDLFADFYPDEWIDQVLAVAALTPRHTYQCLTKRADRMHDYFQSRSKSISYWETAARKIGYTLKFNDLGLVRFPLQNWRQGVSIEDQERVDERLPLLLRAPLAFRWASIEPLLGEVDISPYLGKLDFDRIPGRGDGFPYAGKEAGGFRGLDWAVVGGESGQSARTTTIGHIRRVVEQFRAAGTPIFVKQLGARPVNREGALHPVVHSKGGDPSEWPEDLRVREFPAVEVQP